MYFGGVMKPNIYLKIYIVFMPIILSACTKGIPLDSMPLQPVPKESITSQSIYINGDKYNSIMEYDKNAGIILIDFFDANNQPAKIVRAKTTKAKLILPNSKFEMIMFKNPAIKSYPSGSRAKRQWRLKPKGEVIYAKDERLKNISHFSLFVQLKIYGNNYLLNYVFHQKPFQQDSGAMQMQSDVIYS